jgi:NAD(P)-dependent dehydrogenase (short-subunit alcohol dehydrogenase family)
VNSDSARDTARPSIDNLLSLHGRTAVVTGGARGIGYAICDRLAEAGATVVVADVNEHDAQESAETIAETRAANVQAFGVDVSNAREVDTLAHFADTIESGLTIWVNNAGLYPSTPLAEIDDVEWRRTMNVTLDGTFYGCRAAARAMIARPELSGRVIINMSSLSGLRGRRHLAGYVSAKHGVTGLVRALAVELGAEGIRVNGIAPSVVDTPGMRRRRESAAPEEAAYLKQLEQSTLAAIPMGRVGVADDVARMALYFASDLSDFVTGVVVPVDGGASAS